MVISNLTFITMNIIEKVDCLFLKIAQKSARKIYHLTGVNNFFLSKILFSLSWVILSSSSFLESYQKGNKYFIGDFFLSLFWGFFCLLIWSSIKRLSFLCGKGFQNPARILMFDVRLLFMSNSTLMFFLAIIKPYSVFLLGFSGVLFFLSVGLYFGSIEPEDPNDSLLKKLWKKIKEACSFEPLPEPA